MAANRANPGWDTSSGRRKGEPVDRPDAAASRTVAAGGIDWHVARSGAGRTLLLIHGTGSSTHTWAGCMPVLAAHFDVVAIDLPGHGASTRPAGFAMSLTNVCRAIGALLTTLRAVPDAVVGHSAGAAIALALCRAGLADPARIVGINAALTPFGGQFAPLAAPLAKVVAAMPLLPALIRSRARDEAAVERILTSTGSRLDRRGVAAYQYLLAQPGHVEATMRMMADWDLSTVADDLAMFASRCVLLVARNDSAVPPSEARRLKRRYPDLTIDYLDGLGHLAHEEAPDLVAERLLRILGGEVG